MRHDDSRGHRWALGRRLDIADLYTPRTYMTRWRLIQTPWFGVYLHAIRLPDHDRHLHNHPWPFASLILWGGYEEEHARDFGEASLDCRLNAAFGPTCRRGVERAWRSGSIHRMRLTEFHSVARLFRSPTWTLVFVGRRTQGWGYATRLGFVDHERYHAEFVEIGDAG